MWESDASGAYKSLIILTFTKYDFYFWEINYAKILTTVLSVLEFGKYSTA